MSIYEQARIKLIPQCSATFKKHNCRCRLPEGHENEHEFIVIWEQDVVIQTKPKKGRQKDE